MFINERKRNAYTYLISNFWQLRSRPFKSTVLGSCLVCLGLNTPLGVVVLVLTPCGFVGWHRRYGGTFSLRFQSWGNLVQAHVVGDALVKLCRQTVRNVWWRAGKGTEGAKLNLWSKSWCVAAVNNERTSSTQSLQPAERTRSRIASPTPAATSQTGEHPICTICVTVGVQSVPTLHWPAVSDPWSGAFGTALMLPALFLFVIIWRRFQNPTLHDV